MSTTTRYWRILRTIRRWRRNRQAARRQGHDLQCAGAAEVERLARKLGLSTSELYSMVTHLEEHQLLGKRIASLHLQSTKFADPGAAQLRDLRSVCRTCGYKFTCALDLVPQDLGPAWQDWREYCPNADALEAFGGPGYRPAPPPGNENRTAVPKSRSVP